jgi:large subunit ribosomal protein L29
MGAPAQGKKRKADAMQEMNAKMKLNHAVTPLENPMQIKFTRRTVARLKTELRNRELQAK